MIGSIDADVILDGRSSAASIPGPRCLRISTSRIRRACGDRAPDRRKSPAMRYPAQERVIVFVLIRLEIEVTRDPGQRFIPDPFDEFPHKAVIGLPSHSRRPYRGLFGACRNLVRMQVAQAELIYQGLFDRLMQNEEAIGIDPAGAKCERPRHMPIDVDRIAIAAISGEIRNVVPPVELFDLANHGVERAIHHEARHIPFRHPQLFWAGTFRGHRLFLRCGTLTKSARRLAPRVSRAASIGHSSRDREAAPRPVNSPRIACGTRAGYLSLNSPTRPPHRPRAVHGCAAQVDRRDRPCREGNVPRHRNRIRRRAGRGRRGVSPPIAKQGRCRSAAFRISSLAKQHPSRIARRRSACDRGAGAE
jgi:hypothetical protein